MSCHAVIGQKLPIQHILQLSYIFLNITFWSFPGYKIFKLSLKLSTIKFITNIYLFLVVTVPEWQFKTKNTQTHTQSWFKYYSTCLTLGLHPWKVQCKSKTTRNGAFFPQELTHPTFWLMEIPPTASGNHNLDSKQHWLNLLSLKFVTNEWSVQGNVKEELPVLTSKMVFIQRKNGHCRRTV
jgi:hypothetical protein